MPDLASLVAQRHRRRLRGWESREVSSDLPHAGTLVVSGYGRRDYYLRRLLAASDVVCLALAMVIALALAGATRGHPVSEYLLFGLITLPAWVVLFKMYGLYERDAKRLSHSTLDDLPSLFHGLLLGSLLIWLWFDVVAPAKLVFATILAFAGVAMALVLAGRAVTRACFVRITSPERVLLIGSGQASGVLIEKMRGKSSLRLEPIGMLNCKHRASPIVGLRQLGMLEDVHLPSVIAEHRVMRVVVADSDVDGEQLLELLRDCKATGTKVSLLPATFSAMGPAVEVDDVQGVTVLGINPPVLARSSRWAKRVLDVVGAGIALVALFPLLALLALLVRIDSPGPALFRQERIGQRGRRFKLVKLRTMFASAEARRAELVAQSKDPGWLHLERDPRITRVGRFLRLTSLDELPQLWNVLRGDMSLVGPRPLIPEEDSMVDDWARARLDLTPGITGLWQVLGRTSIPFEEMVKLDYLYVTNWSLWGDVRLILRTLPVVVRRSGAN
jgi:exopolysaccharide biosynthesis polyprenyl glycosylphosphotransferase